MIREKNSDMMVFDSFEELKKFMNSISDFLVSRPFHPLITPPSSNPLDEPFYGPIKSCLENILPSKCKKMLKDENHWENFIKITWTITAMVHDFGYPIELVERKYTGDELFLCSKNYLQTNRLKDYFENHFKRCIPLFKNQLKKIDKKVIDSPFRHCDAVHPIIGSLELLHFLKNHYSKLKGGKEIYRYIYQLAALGIFEHHKDGKIDFDLNPFGYILVLADTLHEWHRYICIGAVKSSSTKLKFVSPITRMSIKRKSRNFYNIQFRKNPRNKKCKGWDPMIFKKAKIEELKRLKKKPGLPQFFID